MTIFSNINGGLGPGITYTTGAYVPIAKGSAGDPTVTYAQQVGAYIKIGKLCFVTLFVNWNGGNYVGGAGNSGFTLPFAAKNTANLQQGFVFVSGAGQGSGYIASVQPGDTVAYVGSNTGLISVATQAGLGSNNITGCYYTDV